MLIGPIVYNSPWRPILVRQDQFSDSLPADRGGYRAQGGVAATSSSEAAILSCVLNGQLNVQVVCDSVLNSPASARDIAVKVDGVYQGAISPAVSSTGWFAVNPPAGTHTVDLVVGQARRTGAVGTLLTGSWITAVSGQNLQIIKRTSTRRMLFYCDSLGQACSTQQGNNDLVGQMRLFYPGRISVEGFGFRASSDDTDARLIPRIVNYAADAQIVDVVTLIGTNDYGLTTQSPAAFQTLMTNRIVAIAGNLGSKLRQVWVIQIPTRGTETTNGLGTTPQYRTSLINAVAANPGTATLIDCNGVLVLGTDYQEANPNQLHFVDLGVQHILPVIRAGIGF